MTDTKYARGKIYKLIARGTNDVYIGSTTAIYLSVRLCGHRQNFNSYLKGKFKYVSSFELFRYDVDDIEIVLVEKYPCNNNEELRIREAYWQKIVPCVNTLSAFTNKNEYNKQLYQEKKEQVRAKHKNYYNDNKVKLTAKHKEYSNNHKEKTAQYQKTYRAKKENSKIATINLESC